MKVRTTSQEHGATLLNATTQAILSKLPSAGVFPGFMNESLPYHFSAAIYTESALSELDYKQNVNVMLGFKGKFYLFQA
jgi:hypothetical protein